MADGQPRRVRHGGLEPPGDLGGRRHGGAAGHRQAVAGKTGCPIVEATACRRPRPRPPATRWTAPPSAATSACPCPHRARCSTTTAEVVPWATGEIAIRGPQVMAGYWQRPDETAKVMTADGFSAPATSAWSTSAATSSIVDRKKDMILVSGFNVYPNEVEDVMTQMDGILECAAVGIPDEKAGEAVKLVIVKKNPAVTGGRRARLLRGQPDRLQAAEGGGVPHRAAQDAGGQDPEAGAAREVSRARCAEFVLHTERGEAEACRSARRPISVLDRQAPASPWNHRASRARAPMVAGHGRAGRAARISGRARLHPMPRSTPAPCHTDAMAASPSSAPCTRSCVPLPALDKHLAPPAAGRPWHRHDGRAAPGGHDPVGHRQGGRRHQGALLLQEIDVQRIVFRRGWRRLVEMAARGDVVVAREGCSTTWMPRRCSRARGAADRRSRFPTDPAAARRELSLPAWHAAERIGETPWPTSASTACRCCTGARWSAASFVATAAERSAARRVARRAGGGDGGRALAQVCADFGR